MSYETITAYGSERAGMVETISGGHGQLHLCDRCGAVAYDVTVHDAWHDMLNELARKVTRHVEPHSHSLMEGRLP